MHDMAQGCQRRHILSLTSLPTTHHLDNNTTRHRQHNTTATTANHSHHHLNHHYQQEQAGRTRCRTLMTACIFSYSLFTDYQFQHDEDTPPRDLPRHHRQALSWSAMLLRAGVQCMLVAITAGTRAVRVYYYYYHTTTTTTTTTTTLLKNLNGYHPCYS